MGNVNRNCLSETDVKSRSELFSLQFATSFSPGDLAAPALPMSATTLFAVLMADRHEDALADGLRFHLYSVYSAKKNVEGQLKKLVHNRDKGVLVNSSQYGRIRESMHQTCDSYRHCTCTNKRDLF